MTTYHHPYTGDCTIELTFEGAHDKTRVIKDRFGYYFVQYLYSEKNDHWRFFTGTGDNMSHPRVYLSLKSAIARARRAVAPAQGAH